MATAWRYWRFNISADNGGGGVECADMALKVSGVNQVGSGTATAKNQFGSFDPNLAVDGNPSTTYWASDFATGYPCWWQYDFGAGNDVALDEWTYAAFGGGNRTPKDFTIEASADGTTWVTAKTVTGETVWPIVIGTSHTYTFTSPDPAGPALPNADVLEQLVETLHTDVATADFREQYVEIYGTLPSTALIAAREEYVETYHLGEHARVDAREVYVTVLRSRRVRRAPIITITETIEE